MTARGDGDGLFDVRRIGAGVCAFARCAARSLGSDRTCGRGSLALECAPALCACALVFGVCGALRGDACPMGGAFGGFAPYPRRPGRSSRLSRPCQARMLPSSPIGRHARRTLALLPSQQRELDRPGPTSIGKSGSRALPRQPQVRTKGPHEIGERNRLRRHDTPYPPGLINAMVADLATNTIRF